MRILVTGGAGFIGSHIVEHFQGSADVRVLDDLRSGFRQNLDGLGVTFYEGSILDRELVRQAVDGVDFVFHLAALVSVPESMREPVECVRVNTVGLLNLLQASSAAKVRKLCFSSSAAIYGNNPSNPKLETMNPEPMSPYAVTKLDGEFYSALFQREGMLKTVSLRYFNVFGPRQDPNSPYAAAVPIFIDRAIKNEGLTIYGDGKQTRDFIFVKDIVSANVFAATTSSMEGVYNVAYGQRISINDLAHRIIRLTGSHSMIRYESERAGDVKHSQACTKKLLNRGFRPSSNFDEGLRQTIEYFRTRSGSVRE